MLLILELRDSRSHDSTGLKFDNFSLMICIIQNYPRALVLLWCSICPMIVTWTQLRLNWIGQKLSSHPTTQEYKAHCDRQRFANLWTNLNLTITLVQLMDYSIMLIQYFVEGNLEVSIKLKYGIFFNNCSHNSFQLEVRIDKVCLWDSKAGNGR